MTTITIEEIKKTTPSVVLSAEEIKELDELRTKPPNEVREYIINAIDKNDRFVNYTKGQLISIYAESYERSGLAGSEIIDMIVDTLSDRGISRSYVLRNIPDRMKNQTKSAAGKLGIAARLNKAQLLEENKPNKFRSDEEIEREHIEESTSTSISTIKDDPNYLYRDPVSDIPNIEENNIDSDIQEQEESIDVYDHVKILEDKLKLAEDKIEAMAGDLPYADCIQSLRIVKLDKYKMNMFDEAMKAAQSHVVFYVDIRNGSITNIITDKEHKKLEKSRK